MRDYIFANLIFFKPLWGVLNRHFRFSLQTSFTFTEQVILRRHELKYDDNNCIPSSSTWLKSSKRKKDITLP